MSRFFDRNVSCHQQHEGVPHVHVCSWQNLAEICHNGYVDALRFLRERGELFIPHHRSSVLLLHTHADVSGHLSVTELLEMQLVPLSLVAEVDTGHPCCDTLLTGPHQGDHWWLDPGIIQNLPDSFKTGKEDNWAWLVLVISPIK